MSLENLKVRTRLMLGFGSAIVLGMLIATIGAYNMHGMAGQLDELANRRMVVLDKITDYKDNLNTSARSVRNIMLQPDVPATVETEKKRMLDLRATNAQLLSDLKTRVNSPEGRAFLQTIGDTQIPYNQSIDSVVALSLDGKREDAIKLLFGVLRTNQATLFAAVDGMSDFQNKAGNTMAIDSAADAAFFTTLMVGMAVAMAVIGSLLGWAITRSLTKALGAEPAEVSTAMRRVAEGDLQTPIVVAASDSTSMMATAKAMQDSLSRTVSGVRSNAEGVASASAQIAQGNNDLSARTEQQASALEQTAASMEELSSTVKQNADNARQANQLAISASTVAVQGGEVVAQVVETMKDINDSSQKIADIISVIDGIAFQTNILALNAAVEAARAGEQGRGFAVVASEVRSLAGRSAQAAKEIKSLIGSSVERVEQGVALVEKAGTTMAEVVSSIRRVTDIMGEISAASSEQSAGVSQVGEAIIQMDQVTQQNAALVEEMAAAAGSLSSQADELVSTVAVFKLQGGQTDSHQTRHSARPPHRATPASAPSAHLARSAARPHVSAKKPGAKPHAIAKSTLAKSTPAKATAPKAIAHAKDDGDWSSF